MDRQRRDLRVPALTFPKPVQEGALNDGAPIFDVVQKGVDSLWGSTYNLSSTAN
jgi:hypothetical protein